MSQPLAPGLVEAAMTRPVVPRKKKEVLKPSASLTSEVSTRISRASSIEVGYIRPEANWNYSNPNKEASQGYIAPPLSLYERSQERRPSRSDRSLEKELALWRAMKAEFLQPFRPLRCPETSTSSCTTCTTQADSVASWSEITQQMTPPGLSRAHFTDDSGDEAEASSDVEIILGPTQLAACGTSLQDLFLPEDRHGSVYPVPIKSHGQCLVLSDALRLAKARSVSAPLSFGSVAHLATRQPLDCRPCMFEQRPGRCRKSYLCDFCHLSHRRRVKVTKATLTSGIWSV